MRAYRAATHNERVCRLTAGILEKALKNFCPHAARLLDDEDGGSDQRMDRSVALARGSAWDALIRVRIWSLRSGSLPGLTGTKSGYCEPIGDYRGLLGLTCAQAPLGTLIANTGCIGYTSRPECAWLAYTDDPRAASHGFWEGTDCIPSPTANMWQLTAYTGL